MFIFAPITENYKDYEETITITGDDATADGGNGSRH
jgi:hypothetical protein